MNDRMGRKPAIACRVARKRFRSLLAQDSAAGGPRVVPIERGAASSERAATEWHLRECQRCAAEYRVLSLGRATLDAAAAPSEITPSEDFFAGVRARILRGERTVSTVDESWAAALLVTARQLIPAMALLLVLIIGATFVWRSVPPAEAPAPQANIPRLFEDPTPTADEALDSLMAAEEKNNGK